MKKGAARNCTECDGKPKKTCKATTFEGTYCAKPGCMKVVEYMDKVTVKDESETSSE